MSATLEPVLYNTDKWIKENEKYFLPPVCNKMMHNDGQMKVFYVSGPNVRKDYHIEEGEELFYMVKGDMCLKVVEHGRHRDVHIHEGEIFLLPARVAHSPQRKADTIGLVIERERPLNEKDGLRYFQEKDGVPTLDSLYEEWFHCTDLGTQLAPVIKRYFASEAHRTGQPIPGQVPENPPVILDKDVDLQDPFNLHAWIQKNKTKLDTDGSIQLFGDQYQFTVVVYGKGENTGGCDRAETLIWQLEGESIVTVDEKEYTLHTNDTFLIRAGQSFRAIRPQGGVSLICYQDPARERS